MDIRVVLPQHLRTLADVRGTDEIVVSMDAPFTLRSLCDVIEARYPMLRGTIRDQRTLKRRDFVRFFACGDDVSNEPDSMPLPDDVVNGADSFMIVGAIAGG